MMLCLFTSVNAYVLDFPAAEKAQFEEALQANDLVLEDMSIDQFMALTPSKYKEMTGKKLGLKNAVKLKAAQKKIKKHMKKNGDDAADISEGVYILLAILGLAWIAMGLMDDWSGSDWIVNLILTVLCWLPGLIHALVKKSKYY